MAYLYIMFFLGTYCNTQKHGVFWNGCIFYEKHGLEHALNYIQLFVYKDIKQYVNDLHCFVDKCFDCY